MAHTRPDYTTSSKMETIYGEVDNGELAARTGGMSFLDRRGNVMFMDDFSTTTNNYYRSGVGAASAMVISADYFISNDSCMKITAGPGATNYTNVWRYHPSPRNTKLGVEVRYLIDSDDSFVLIGISGYTGAVQYDAWIQYDTGTNNISYYDEIGNYVLIGNAVHDLEVFNYWSFFKVVIDWSTKCYVRAIVGGVEYPLPNIPFYHRASVNDPVIATLMHLTVNGATTTNLYADNLILTQNEP